MLNTIFSKQFLSFIGTLSISFFLLSISLSQAFKTYFEGEKERLLKNQGTYINSIIQNHIREYYDGGIFDDEEFMAVLTEEIENRQKYLNVEFVLVDKEFVIIKATTDVIKSVEGVVVQIPEVKGLSEGKAILVESGLGGLFKEGQITVASPIMIDNKFYGAAIMSSPTPELEKSVAEISRVTLILLFASGAMAMALAYILSRSISRPIYEMNVIVKEISSGDFEKRVEIDSKDEIGQLAKSINTMTESLQEQELQRRSFIANLSHDFRSPLTSMSGFLQAILDGTIPKNSQDRYIQITLEETNRLAKLANDILDINKIQMGELTYSMFDVNELVRKTVIQMENRIIEKNIDFSVFFKDEVCLVRADEEKVRRVLQNLLDNALKFTEADGAVVITTLKKDKKAVVSVKDNGVGLTDEQAKHVFDRFYKADHSRGKDKAGSGLGLSITKEFIKAHGENISLNSKIGEGTEFIFTLPAIDEDI
ncbi:MAG: HAMP domain-containing histidine kinase [Clostridiales bacterium]|nr:HAMP domain-containing histidine kinase [Clostridiales bacterium]